MIVLSLKGWILPIPQLYRWILYLFIHHIYMWSIDTHNVRYSFIKEYPKEKTTKSNHFFTARQQEGNQKKVKIKPTFIREKNPASTSSSSDIHALSHQEVRAFPNQVLQRARSLVEPPTTLITATQNHNSNELRNRLVHQIQRIRIEHFIGVDLKNEGRDLEFGSLVPTGKQGTRWLLGAEELLGVNGLIRGIIVIWGGAAGYGRERSAAKSEEAREVTRVNGWGEEWGRGRGRRRVRGGYGYGGVVGEEGYHGYVGTRLRIRFWFCFWRRFFLYCVNVIIWVCVRMRIERVCVRERDCVIDGVFLRPLKCGGFYLVIHIFLQISHQLNTSVDNSKMTVQLFFFSFGELMFKYNN